MATEIDLIPMQKVLNSSKVSNCNVQTFADIQTFAESKTYVLNSVKDLDYKIRDFCRTYLAIQDFLLFNNHKNSC